MEKMPIGEVPEEETVAQPKKEKTGLSKMVNKVKTGIALGTAIAGIGMSDITETQGADRLHPVRAAERGAHPKKHSAEKTVDTFLGPLTYTNPLDALLTRVPYRPKVIKKNVSFSVGVAGRNARIGARAEVRQSSHVVDRGSQSRKLKRK